MAGDYRNDKSDEHEGLSFDVERQSLPRPSPINLDSRMDSTGLPIPPPPLPVTTPKTKRPLFHDANQTGAESLDMTPPEAKLSFTAKTPPGAKLSFTAITPDTSATFFSRQDEEITFSNQEDTDDNSSTDSDTIVYENYSENRKKRWSLATTSAMVSILLMALLLITVLVGAYFFFFEKGSDDIGQNSEDGSTDWSTVRPSVSATGTSRPPSNSQTQGPGSDLTQSPTRVAKPSPSPFVWTSRPTEAPTLSTPDPTFQPTVTTPDPTPSPTVFGATLSPTNTFNTIITDYLFQDSSDGSVDTTIPAVQKAVKWLVDEATVAQSVPFTLDQKYRQRFGILILYFSVDPNGQAGLPNLGMQNKDECSWTGIRCNENGNRILTEINLPNRQLDGTLPAEWGFFPNLKSIDFSKNELQGSIPEGLYDALELEDIFLYKNKLTGTISSKIGNLWSLEKFHVSHNLVSGAIPPELGSAPDRIRRIRHFNVHRNQMTGSIPSNMRLRSLFHVDLGYNRFSSTFPPDFGTESVRLRHLYLDHNNFEGAFPSEVLNAGGGRLRTLVLNDNKFTGTFPGDHQYNNTMMELAIQNNNFVSMERNTCNLGVFSADGGWSGGELVEFKSDCLVCRCGVDFMCKHCEI